VRCYASEGGLRSGFEYYRALFTNIEQTKEDARTKLEVPLLALGGAASFGQVLAQEWPKYAANVQAEVVPQAGHWIPEEQPALLRERLLAFFGEG
jgi:pimeloyl-ACP methyl ester carboxylesterase